MTRIKHNLDYEMKLLELLGYKLQKSSKRNCWVILDKNNVEVGLFTANRLKKIEVGENTLVPYIYKIIIDSNEVEYEHEYLSKYLLSNGKSLSLPKEKIAYELNIKREDGNKDYLSVVFGERPRIWLNSEKYGLYELRIKPGYVYLNFTSKFEWYNNEDNTKGYYNLEDFLIYDLNENSCTYQKCFCNENDIMDYDRNCPCTTIEISVGKNSLPDEPADDYLLMCNKGKIADIPKERKLIVREKLYKKAKEKGYYKDKLVERKDYVVEGTAEEFVILNPWVKDSMQQFIYLVDSLLPFKNSIMKKLFSQELLARREMQPFKESILEAISWCEANNKNISASSKNGRQMSLK